MKVVREGLLAGAQQADGLPVVIDVMRAFTTSALMFAYGLEQLILVATPEEAFQHKTAIGCITVGEVRGVKVDGFDFGNSPSELLQAPPDTFRGKTAVLRSSAGTRGVVAACKNNPVVLLGSYVLAEAIAKYIHRHSQAEVVTLIPMGNEGEIPAVEDEACADYLQHLLIGTPYDRLSVLWHCLSDASVQKSLRGERAHLPREDVIICLQHDLYNFVLIAEKVGDHIIVRRQDI